MSLVYSLYIILCVVCEYPGRGVAGDLSSRLAHYETLHHRDVSHVIHRRHAVTQTPHRRDVHFKTLGRDFHLYLKSDHHILAPDFEAFAVDSQGSKTNFAVDPDAFYSGFIKGEYHSTVEAYWEDENLHAVIHTPHDVYYVEPSWRHLPKSTNHTMIVYRASDVRKMDDNTLKKHPVCGYVRPEEVGLGPMNTTDTEQPVRDRHRERRQTSTSSKTSKPRSVCPLLLVADYKFYKEIGLNSLTKTAYYLVSLINRVNQYYITTAFESYQKMAFQIQELRIDTSFKNWKLTCKPEDCKAGDYHYNMYKTNWDTRDLLEAFSRDDTYGKFCLAHLFTYEGMGGVLGLAYIASSRSGGLGGVCSPAYYKTGQVLYLNTGWTTSQNRAGNRILTQEADLVTSHEFGHNWGSEHDPDNAECSPSSYKGGKYLMYTYSVSGFENNNKFFSPCSRRSISAVLSAKSSKCFRAPQDGFCGNYKKDENEQCDAGVEGLAGSDPCCEKTCKLKAGKQCSDFNSPCCKNCLYASKSTVCKQQPTGSLSCEGDWLCAGDQSTTCQRPKIFTSTDGKDCIEKGKCQNGVCILYCETLNKTSCLCDTAADSCKYCCQDNQTSPCQVLTKNSVSGEHVPNNRPCFQGYCLQGECKKQIQDAVQRFWTIIENITIDSVVEFMKDNIVGTIIVFSMVIWIPVSCYISHIDRKRRKEDEEEERWMKPQNQAMLREEDVSKVRRSFRTRKRPLLTDNMTP